MLQKNENAQNSKFWIVVDVRCTHAEPASGIARSVKGLVTALVELISRENLHGLRILLVSKQNPPHWAVDLILKFPCVVSWWSGGPGLSVSTLEKPSYLWPTLVFSTLKQFTDGRFLWVAPGNFDRPLNIFGKTEHYKHVLQIIHDAIPLTVKNSTSFFYKLQYGFIVKRTLLRYPMVMTVSDHSAQELKKICSVRKNPIKVISNGIDPVFGSIPVEFDFEKRVAMRQRFLEKTAQMWTWKNRLLSQLDSDQIAIVARSSWVLGVGRSQKYKQWFLPSQAVHQLQKESQQTPICFVHVGGNGLLGNGSKDSKDSNDSDVSAMLSAVSLSDSSLAELYVLSDMLVHPSLAEGFGYPPLEAMLSGLPVLFRQGTAVDDHVSQKLPQHVWRSLATDELAEWVSAIRDMLRGRSKFQEFFSSIIKNNPSLSFREHLQIFLQKNCGWEPAAQQFLEYLYSTPCYKGEP